MDFDAYYKFETWYTVSEPRLPAPPIILYRSVGVLEYWSVGTLCDRDVLIIFRRYSAMIICSVNEIGQIILTNRICPEMLFTLLHYS